MDSQTSFDESFVHNGMDRPDSKSPPNSSGSKRSVAKGNRPSLQIYRPPGLRSGSSNKAHTDTTFTTVSPPPPMFSTQHSADFSMPQYHTYNNNNNNNYNYNSQQQQQQSANKQATRSKQTNNSTDSHFSTNVSESQSENSSKPSQTAGSKQSQHNAGGGKRQNNERPRPRTPTKQLGYGQQRQNSRPLKGSFENNFPSTETNGESGTTYQRPPQKEATPPPAKQQSHNRRPSPGPLSGLNGQRNTGSPNNRGSPQSPGPTGIENRRNSGPRSPGPQRKRGPSPGPEGAANGGWSGGNPSGGQRAPSPGPGGGMYKLPGRQNSFVKEAEKKKKVSLSPGDIEDIQEMVGKLEIKDGGMVLAFIQSGFESEEVGGALAGALVQGAIEEGRGSKGVAKLCSLLMEASPSQTFHQALLSSSWQYYDCRDKLRSEHFKYWLAFVNFVSDLYAAVGFTYEGELVEILFRIFEFMLGSPVLETLKIEELECLISALLGVGYDLERQCPDQLSRLREWIRDAFIHAQEPWARKMILLLVELSASGWKLPPESNDYYFQAAASSL